MKFSFWNDISFWYHVKAKRISFRDATDWRQAQQHVCAKPAPRTRKRLKLSRSTLSCEYRMNFIPERVSFIPGSCKQALSINAFTYNPTSHLIIVLRIVLRLLVKSKINQYQVEFSGLQSKRLKRSCQGCINDSIFANFLQYSILVLNIPMFKRRLNSKLECWLDCCVASRDRHVGIRPEFA